MAKITNEEYKSLQKIVNIANQRIRRVESRYGEASWGINKLYEKIDNKVVKGISHISGLIKVDRSMSKAQYNAIKNATTNFLKSETSSLRGISRIKKNVTESIRTSLSDNEVEVSEKDAEKLYSIIENADTRDTAQKIGASTLWKFLVDAKENNKSDKDFFRTVKNHISYSNNSDFRKDLETIYNKYMK